VHYPGASLHNEEYVHRWQHCPVFRVPSWQERKHRITNSIDRHYFSATWWYLAAANKKERLFDIINVDLYELHYSAVLGVLLHLGFIY